MIGPIVLLIAGAVAGWFSGRWAGLAAGALVAGLVTFGVAAAAAWWAGQVGRALEPEEALRLAPRPPGFGPLCDAIYHRALRAEQPGEEEP